MPDVLDAPLVATRFDDGYSPTSRRTPHFPFRSLTTLSPWRWEVGVGSMSGGVEVTARGGLPLTTTQSPYSTDPALDERQATAASESLLHHHHHHYLTYSHHLHYPRSHLSNLENLSTAHHRVHLPLHARTGKSVTSAAVGSGGRCGLSLPGNTTMRANERWVLLSKETFQEIFDATLHQMTGELISPDDRKSEDADAPPSPTTPEGHLAMRMHGARKAGVLTTATRCHRKRSLSDGADDDEEESEVVSAPSFRLRTAMAPLESAKTTASSSALNDITNDRPGHRFSPAMSTSSSSSSTSESSSPQIMSPSAIATLPHSPLNHQLVTTVALPDRENNEPLDLSNKRSPGDSNALQTNTDWCAQPTGSPKCTPPTWEMVGGNPSASPSAHSRDSRGSSPGLAPGGSATAKQLSQPPDSRQKYPPEGETVRADVRSAPGDPRAPSPCGREVGGSGGPAGVAAANNGLAWGGEGEEDARGSPATTYPAATALRGRESSCSGSSSGGSGSTASAANTLQQHSHSGGGNGAVSRSSSPSTTTTASITSARQHHSKAQASDNNYTPHQREGTQSPTLHPGPAQSGSGMITNTSSGPAAGGGRLVTSPPMRSATAAGQENWVPLSKARVYDLVEEVMISLGEKQQREERATLEERRQQVGSGGGMSGRDPHHHHHHHHQHHRATTNNSQTVKTHRTPATTTSSKVTNNNNNTLKRPHSALELEGAESGSSGDNARRHQSSQRHSPPAPTESNTNVGYQRQEDSPRGQDTVNLGGVVVSDNSRSVVNTPRPGVTTAKSQLRDHLSARSAIQGGVINKLHPPDAPLTDGKATQEESSTNAQERSHHIASTTRGALPRHAPPTGSGGDQEPHSSSSSSTSPTSESKQQQCWVALNKMVVFNIVDSAMRSSETEEEGEEEGKEAEGGSDNEPSGPQLVVSRRTGEVTGDSDSDSSRCGGALSVEERETWNHTHRAHRSDPTTPASCSTQHKANKRQCDTMEAGSEALMEAESAAKRSRAPGARSREGTASPTAHPDPASPLRGCLAEDVSKSHAPPPVSNHSTSTCTASRAHCLHGLLSEPGRVRSPRHAIHSPHSLDTEPHPNTQPTLGSKAHKGAHLADGQPGIHQINAESSSEAGENKHPLESASGRQSPHATSSSATPTTTLTKHQSSSKGVNQVCSAASGTGPPPTSTTTTMDPTTQHGLLPVTKHGMVPVSPLASDARSSPRLGWVAVSKIDVHNIVDSVVDSMIAGGDMLTSSSSTSPCDDVSDTSPVPSSTSPPSHRSSSVTSPASARNADGCQGAGSPPQCSSEMPTVYETARSSPQPEVDQCTTGRDTPSPFPASPGSPHSPGDGIDRFGDAKSTKAFKWKSSLLMRVEEEKIDVTPELSVPPSSGGRSAQARTGSAKQHEQKSESRSLRSGKRAARKSVNNPSSKLK